MFYIFQLRISLALLLIAACGLTADVGKGGDKHGTQIVTVESEILRSARKKAFALYSNQQYEEAIDAYLHARELALSEKNYALANHFLNNVAGSYFALASYQNATKYFNLAVAEARRHQFSQLETMAAYNIASIHLALGQAGQALEVLRQFPLDGSSMGRDAKLDGLLLQGNVFTRLKREPEARQAFGRALAEADLDPPASIQAANSAKLARWPESVRELRRAWVFTVMSQSLVVLEHPDEAEIYILEAFRIRSIYQEKARLRDALQYAMLLRQKGDYSKAKQLLDVARHLDPGNRTPMHRFLIDREAARIHLAQKDFAMAVPALRSALAQARRWRMQVLPTDSGFLNFESYLAGEVQKAFLGAIVDPSFPLAQAGLAEESFWVAEEARFASMRASQFPTQDFASRFPTKYWQKLARFQALQSVAFHGSKARSAERASLELELNRLELEAGLLIPNASADGNLSFREWQRQLRPDEVVFSYYLGEPFSLAWIVDSRSVKVWRMVGQKQFVQWIEAFRTEIMDPSQKGTSSTGLELSKQLFGEFLSTNRTTPFWTMVLDQQLSTLPIAALPTGHDGTRYLVEEHSLRVLPSAIFLKRNQEQDWEKKATGIGDPVYNQADARVSPLQNVSADWLQLNRLPASTQELARSMTVLRANHWATEERTGMSATVATLRSTLERSPDILHLSTHFVPQAGSAHLLAIGLSPERGGNTVFTALDLNSVRTRTKLVVLSGCSSSTGEIVPSIGINGLSRAFLIAGVSTVVATLWPTLDSEGPIFPAFYSNLMSRKWSPRAAAEALRAAQLEMIRHGGWTSRPAYWAAYLAISKG